MEKHLRKKRRKRFRSFIFAIRVLACLIVLGGACFYLFVSTLPFILGAQRITPPIQSAAPHGEGLDLSLNSAHAILINSENGAVLFEKKGAAKIYPASMTKIMTAVVAVEALSDLNEQIRLRKEMYAVIYKSNAATAGFLPNEEVRAIDLLYGLLLPSGAECALGLAEHIAGSEAAFVDLMNRKAQALGLQSTHFVNATGLHHPKHTSTVKDIATLLEYALHNDTFYKIITATRHSTPPTNLHSDGITYYSTLFSNMDGADFKSGSILGGKTGYTPQAGQCLASFAEINGRRYLLVTCGAPGDNKTQILHIEDAFTAYAAIEP